MWGYDCCISAKIMHSCLLTCNDRRVKHLKDRSHNAQNRRSGEISSRIFETYNNYVRPHGCHIYNTGADMSMATMCPCTSKHHGIPHCKFVLCCSDKFPIIVLPSQDANKNTTNMCPIIIFHVYCNFSRWTVYGRRLYHEWTTCSCCSTVTSSNSTSKV